MVFLGKTMDEAMQLIEERKVNGHIANRNSTLTDGLNILIQPPGLDLSTHISKGVPGWSPSR